MSSYRQILYHIIFRTKNGTNSIDLEHSKELYAYIHGIIKNKNTFLYRINGMEDHLHILSDLHPSIALADFVRDIKAMSSSWLKEHECFKNFDGWADGYGAFTYSMKELDTVKNYIINQQVHHQTISFTEEYKALLLEHKINVDERFFP